jgi:hypothetical protein
LRLSAGGIIRRTPLVFLLLRLRLLRPWLYLLPHLLWLLLHLRSWLRLLPHRRRLPLHLRLWLHLMLPLLLALFSQHPWLRRCLRRSLRFRLRAIHLRPLWWPNWPLAITRLRLGRLLTTNVALHARLLLLVSRGPIRLWIDHHLIATRSARSLRRRWLRFLVRASVLHVVAYALALRLLGSHPLRAFLGCNLSTLLLFLLPLLPL